MVSPRPSRGPAIARIGNARLGLRRVQPVGERPERRLHLNGRPAPSRPRCDADRMLAHLALRRHGLPCPARYRGETPRACPRPVRAGGGPAAVALAAAAADRLPGRGRGGGRRWSSTSNAAPRRCSGPAPTWCCARSASGPRPPSRPAPASCSGPRCSARSSRSAIARSSSTTWPRVDRVLAAGTRQHAYVDRFFFWHERMAPRFGQQLLFYRPPGEAGATRRPGRRAAGGGFYAEPAWAARCGGSANACARRAKPSRSRRSCSTACRIRPSSTTCGRTRSGPRSSRSSASSSISTTCGAARFGRLAATDLEPLLNLGADLPRLALRVEDAGGRRITGPDRDAGSLPSASERVDILFFPSRELGNYLAPLPPVASWRLIVRPEVAAPRRLVRPACGSSARSSACC